MAPPPALDVHEVNGKVESVSVPDAGVKERAPPRPLKHLHETNVIPLGVYDELELNTAPSPRFLVMRVNVVDVVLSPLVTEITGQFCWVKSCTFTVLIVSVPNVTEKREL